MQSFAVKTQFGRHRRGRLPIWMIAEEAARVYGVTAAEVLGKARFGYIVRARHATFWIAYEAGLSSLAAIGREMGRDHSTVLVGIRHMTARLVEDAVERRRVFLVARLACERAGVPFPDWLSEDPDKLQASVKARGRPVPVRGIALADPVKTPALPPPTGQQSAFETLRALAETPFENCEPFSKFWWLVNDAKFRVGVARAFGVGEAAE